MSKERHNAQYSSTQQVIRALWGKAIKYDTNMHFNTKKTEFTAVGINIYKQCCLEDATKVKNFVWSLTVIYIIKKSTNLEQKTTPFKRLFPAYNRVSRSHRQFGYLLAAY